MKQISKFARARRRNRAASKIGKLDKALDEAAANGWSVVDMKLDWKVVFSAPRKVTEFGAAAMRWSAASR